MTHIKRNEIMAFTPDWLTDIRVNKSATEARCATYGTRRAVKKDHQLAWLLHVIGNIDLTTLSGDDTDARVKRLCAKAIRPVRADILTSLGVPDLKLQTGAVCVFHYFVATAVDALKGTGIPVAAVSTGFPHGLSPLETRIREVELSVADGAKEIDIVIERNMVLSGDWKGLYELVVSYRQACGDAHLKTIIATGELGTLKNVAKASMVCMMAGADFIKTSTGKESVNATLPVSLTMARMIREYYERTGFKIGYKPAGGISDAKTSLIYLSLMREELGHEWMQPALFRFGASSLLNDIERQLEHGATGRYSASYRHSLV